MDFKSQKGRPQKSLDGFIYSLDKNLKNGMESWRCRKRLCKGRIYIVDGKVSKSQEHNHEPNLVESEVKQYLSAIREKALTTVGAPKDLIEQDLAELSPEALVKLPKFSATQRMIERKRKSIRDAMNPNNVNGTPAAQMKENYNLSASLVTVKPKLPTTETTSSADDQRSDALAREIESPAQKRKKSDSFVHDKGLRDESALAKLNVKDNCDDLFLASLSKEFKKIKNEESKLDLKILILQLVRSAIQGSSCPSIIEDYQEDISTLLES